MREILTSIRRIIGLGRLFFASSSSGSSPSSRMASTRTGDPSQATKGNREPAAGDGIGASTSAGPHGRARSPVSKVALHGARGHHDLALQVAPTGIPRPAAEVTTELAFQAAPEVVPKQAGEVASHLRGPAVRLRWRSSTTRERPDINSPNLAPQVASNATPCPEPGPVTQDAHKAATESAPATAPPPPVTLPSRLEFYPFTPEQMATSVSYAEEFCSRSGCRVITISSRGALPADMPSAAAKHAYLMIQWLRGSGYGSADIPAHDLQKVYPAFCIAMGLELQPWQTVARYLRYFTGGDRLYRRIAGKNVRVYWIPDPDWQL